MEVSKIQMEKKELVLFGGKKILKKLYEKIKSAIGMRYQTFCYAIADKIAFVSIESGVRLHSYEFASSWRLLQVTRIREHAHQDTSADIWLKLRGNFSYLACDKSSKMSRARLRIITPR